MTDVEASLNARLRPLKVTEYEALARLGAFDHEKVELIRGRVVVMAPQGEQHAWTSGSLTGLLVEAFGRWAEVRPGAPLVAGETSMPEPDFMLIPKSLRPGPHPYRAMLLVEISVSSLRDDRLVKAPLDGDLRPRPFGQHPPGVLSPGGVPTRRIPDRALSTLATVRT